MTGIIDVVVDGGGGGGCCWTDGDEDGDATSVSVKVVVDEE